MAAGISVDYYTRLEQGRERNPSDSVLASLAHVLRLDDDQRTHLFNLVRHSRRSTSDSKPVRATVRQLLESVDPSPAYVLDQVNNLLLANPQGWALLSGIDQWPMDRRNSIRYLFLHPTARTLFPQWRDVALHSVAHLRAMHGDYPHDPRINGLIAELSAKSEEFDDLWCTHEVRPRTSGLKVFQHPEVGPMELTYEVLAVSGGVDQRLVVYQAPQGTSDHDAMLLLSLFSRQRGQEVADSQSAS